MTVEPRGAPILNRRSDRREVIVEAATSVFAHLGYAGASLRELAAAAGIEKGHLTYYFPTKEALLFEIINDLHNRFLGGKRQWTQAGPPGDALLVQVFSQHVELVIDSTEATRVAYDNFRFLRGSRRITIISHRAEYERLLAELIDSCRVASTVVDLSTRLLSKTVLAQLNWPYQWYSPDGSLTPQDLARTLSTRALASLRPI